MLCLERAADRVTNLCERMVYGVTGELVELSADDSALESVSRSDASRNRSPDRYSALFALS
jgi:phosphate uptake regulator